MMFKLKGTTNHKGKSMTVLHTSEATGISLSILDKDNFGIGKVTKGKDNNGNERDEMLKPGFFTSLESAMKRMAHLDAMEGCSDLASYIDAHKAALTHFETIIQEAGL